MMGVVIMQRSEWFISFVPTTGLAVPYGDSTMSVSAVENGPNAAKERHVNPSQTVCGIRWIAVFSSVGLLRHDRINAIKDRCFWSGICDAVDS
jgi:hypothetical protein